MLERVWREGNTLALLVGIKLYSHYGRWYGDQPWDFFGRNNAKAETAVLWPPHVKSWLTGKVSDAGRDWGEEEKGTTEDEMAEWHHRLDGREFEWTPGDGDRQGGLVCCDSWGRRVGHDWATELNWCETSQSKNTTWVQLWHSRKGKTMETEEGSVVSRDSRAGRDE